MEELVKEKTDVCVCCLDAFSLTSVDEFYSAFANAVFSGMNIKADDLFSDATRYFAGSIPSFSTHGKTSGVLMMDVKHKFSEDTRKEILDLPEKLAEDKGVRVIICIDEFQQLTHLAEYVCLENEMRSVWLYQKQVSYCLYGIRKHAAMEIFNNIQKPFYKFSNLMFLSKISKEDWIPFIVNGFAGTGKFISEEFAAAMCNFTDCHPWYLQQLGYFVWTDTVSTVTKDILERAFQRIININAPMFVSDIEKLTLSQRSMLMAIAAGVKRLYAEEVRNNFNLGNLNTITRNKEVLKTKSFVDMEEDTLIISDPIFFKWCIKRFNLSFEND
ncbi:MAG: ATP-binding protein [Bacteroidales bacterium]|nr:ATP-binding protein [Bacteroidales bacterium]